jgi:hypothetical protein
MRISVVSPLWKIRKGIQRVYINVKIVQHPRASDSLPSAPTARNPFLHFIVNLSFPFDHIAPVIIVFFFSGQYCPSLTLKYLENCLFTFFFYNFF